MATTNNVGELRVSENSRVQVGNFYNTVTSVPNRPETPSKPSFLVPFRRDADFVERKTILDRLQACPSPASRTALFGLGGVGKSQLVIEHVYRVRDAFKQNNKEIWVFWVHAATRARVEEGFKTIADAVKVPGWDQPQADIFQLVYRWLSNENNGQWLMVLDSADDSSVFDTTLNEGQASPLLAYLPQSENGSILITTRDRNVGFKLTGGWENVTEVGAMTHEDGLALLEKKIGPDIDDAHAIELVKVLECMPLAISQAAAYIHQMDELMSIARYLHIFQGNAENRLSLLNQDNGDLGRDPNTKNSVITTWQISFDHIHKTRESAADLLSLMSFFDSQAIQESLIRPKNQPETWDSGFEHDVMTLRNFCLIKVHETGDEFEMHGLVQLATRKWLDIRKKTEEYKMQYLYRLNDALPETSVVLWANYGTFSPHFTRVMNNQPIDKKSIERWIMVLLKFGSCSITHGNYHTAQISIEVAVKTATNVFGAEHTLTTDAIQTLVQIYIILSCFDKAEKRAEPLLKLSMKLRGLGNVRTHGCMELLGRIYYRQSRFEEAEKLQVQVVEQQERSLEPQDHYKLSSTIHLSLTYLRQGRLKEAETQATKAVEFGKGGLGPEHPCAVDAIYVLGQVFYQQERFKEAEELQVQVLKARERMLGREHPVTQAIIYRLAWTWEKLGRKDEAIELMEECAQGTMRALGDQHPDTQNAFWALRSWCGEEPQLEPSIGS
ncbi:P-loop containing nucleoside triphosphate hydrolase protein [Xylaria palmicola]|nr:P-loop containing nucleoside triphosphate hydrolase protein [Xylaria palmicola]